MKTRNWLRDNALKHPIRTFLSVVLPLSWISLTTLFFIGLPIEIGILILNYVGLLGMATLITYWLDGREGIKKLYKGLIKWRVGWGYYCLVLFAIPLLTLMSAQVMGTLDIPQDKWLAVATSYIISLVSGALIINLWEETAWSGFVQKRLMNEHGILKGALLTALGFIGIHLPLLLQQHGAQDVLLSFLALAVLGLFFRFLLGMLFVDTGGSILLVGLLHASFNSSGSLGGYDLEIASITATILLTLLFAAYRLIKKKSFYSKLTMF